MPSPSQDNLRAQLQVDDPSTPANAMQTLARWYADWFPKHVQALQKGGEDVAARRPMGPETAEASLGGIGSGGLAGTVRAGQLQDALKALLAKLTQPGQQIPRASPNATSIEGKLLYSLENYPRWWDRNLANVGGRGPTELSPLGFGSEAFAFGVIPKGRDSVEVLKPFGNRKQLDVATQLPEGALPATSLGLSPDNRTGYITQPFAQMMDEFRGTPPKGPMWSAEDLPGYYNKANFGTPVGDYHDVIRELARQSMRSGWNFKDPHSGNVGIYRGRPAVVDLGAYEPFPWGHPLRPRMTWTESE